MSEAPQEGTWEIICLTSPGQNPKNDDEYHARWEPRSVISIAVHFIEQQSIGKLKQEDGFIGIYIM